MKRKLLSLLLACIMVFSMSAVSVAAAEVTPKNEQTATTATMGIMPLASNYFSGITGKMNSLNGIECAKQPISSGSIAANSSVAGVKVNVTVSSGSSPFYLYVYAPNGNYDYALVSKSGDVTFSKFNGYDPKGTWYISIRTSTTGATVVSTATARMTVDYNY